MDVCHVDEVGFSPTLAPNYTWGERGRRVEVPYEAPAGRRVNAIGAYFTEGPAAGRFVYETWAVLPKSRARKPRKSLAERAAQHGLTEAEVGVLDGERFIGFIWTLAGRPANAAPDWRRDLPVWVVLDNYSVHKSGRVDEEQARWRAAGIELGYLPAYSPKLSKIEPVWNDVKHHQMPVRSYPQAGDLQRAVEAALAHKATLLRAKAMETTNLSQTPT
jgi:putative transposase